MKNKLSALILLTGIAVVSFLFILTKNEKKPEKKFLRAENEKHSDAMDALRFLSFASAFPNKDLPPDAYVKAINWYKQNDLSTERTNQSTTSWIGMGPRNMGVRTLAIALDPTDTSVIWLGSAS